MYFCSFFHFFKLRTSDYSRWSWAGHACTEQATFIKTNNNFPNFPHSFYSFLFSIFYFSLLIFDISYLNFSKLFHAAEKGESQNGCFKKTKHAKLFGKFNMFCFLEAPALRFALLVYYGRSIPGLYLEPSRTSMINIFNERLLAVNYFRKKAPS